LAARLRKLAGRTLTTSQIIDDCAVDRVRVPHCVRQQLAKGKSMIDGTVKFYNEQRGFGFIQPADGGKDVFVHATALERAGIARRVEGQRVSFDTELDNRSGKAAVGKLEAI
jgi:CspA family cold shock protein